MNKILIYILEDSLSSEDKEYLCKVVLTSLGKQLSKDTFDSLSVVTSSDLNILSSEKFLSIITYGENSSNIACNFLVSNCGYKRSDVIGSSRSILIKQFSINLDDVKTVVSAKATAFSIIKQISDFIVEKTKTESIDDNTSLPEEVLPVQSSSNEDAVSVEGSQENSVQEDTSEETDTKDLFFNIDLFISKLSSVKDLGNFDPIFIKTESGEELIITSNNRKKYTNSISISELLVVLKAASLLSSEGIVFRKRTG